jgi:hypothetical protein
MVSSDSIQLVTDSVTCDTGARAVAARVGPSAELWPVWVIAIGTTRFVAFDGRLVINGRVYASVFDASFAWIADIPV